MDYIKEMNAFYDLDMANQLTPNAVALYFALLNIANKLFWRTEFVVSNLTLQSKSGIVSRQTLSRARKQLVDLGLISYKASGSVTQAGFYTIIGCVSQIQVKNVTHDDAVYQNHDKNVTENDTNNDLLYQNHDKNVTINKLNKTKLNKTKIDPPNPPEPKKIKFAEFVTMTEREHQTLVSRFGKNDTERLIEILDNYKGSKGKRYKSDYRAILSWVVNRLEEEKKKNGGMQASGTRIPQAFADLIQMREEIEENERKRSAQSARTDPG